MTYEEMTAKLGKGEPLTKEEFEEFGKITRPTTRFNEVSTAKQQLNDKVKELESTISSLEADKVKMGQEAEDKASEKLKELSGQIETLTGENTQLKAFKEYADRLTKVRGIANNKTLLDGATFKDPEYLSILFDRAGVDLANEEQVKTFIGDLKKDKPEQFMLPVTSGSGTGSNAPNQGSAPVKFESEDDRVKYIATHGFEAYQKATK